MGGICGSYGTIEDLNPLVNNLRKDEERVLYALNPGVAKVGKEGRCLGEGFLLGNIYSEVDIESALEGKIEDVAKSLSDISRTADGEFFITAFDSGKLCLARDYCGKLPVYIQDSPLFAFSTKKGKSDNGFPSQRLQDGSCVLVKNNKVVKTYKRPKLSFSRKRIDIFESVPLITQELENAITRRIAFDKKPSILFSGGLDSSLIAKIAARECDPSLITIGSDCSEDVEVAMAFEQELGVGLKCIEITPDLLEKEIPGFIKNLYDPSIMDVEIALPFYLAARHSDSKLIMSGQGADELFGGYYRYNEAYKESPAAFEKMQLKDIEELGEKNLERDQIAVKLGKSHLTTPYLTPKMIDIALKTDTMTKINVRHNKLVLRKIGQSAGLPKMIYERNKKALQYGSGIHSIFKKMAKEKGFTKENAKSGGYMGPLEMLIASFLE